MSNMVKANKKFPQVGGKLETFLNDEVNQAGVNIFSIPWDIISGLCTGM